jgi:hypothetical protein
MDSAIKGLSFVESFKHETEERPIESKKVSFRKFEDDRFGNSSHCHLNSDQAARSFEKSSRFSKRCS